MFTILQLSDAKVIRAWDPPGAALPVRHFYYTGSWREGFDKLPSVYKAASLTPTVPVRTRLETLINQFTDGTPAVRLVRRLGQGMDPICVRMRPPRTQVVEFRTRDTRTFGFFSRPNVFIAIGVELTDIVKAEDLYHKFGDRVVTFAGRVSRNEIDGKTDAQHLITD